MRTVHIVPAAAALVASLGLGGTASAAPPAHETFHDEFSFTDDNFCDTGVTIEGDVVVNGRGMIRARGQEALIYFSEHIIVEVTFTNPDTGATMTTVEQSLSKDLHVIDNGNGTLTVVVLATGNYTMYGADGKAIGRNPGQFRFELLVDHGGTPNDPEDDTELDFQVLKESTGRTDDFCAVAIPALT
jgi:hypothetical protein